MVASDSHLPWERAKRRPSKNARKSRSSFYKTAPRTALARQMASKQHAPVTHKAAQIALRTVKKVHEAATDGRMAAKKATAPAYLAARRVLKKAMSETGVIQIDKAAAIKAARYEYLRREIAP